MQNNKEMILALNAGSSSLKFALFAHSSMKRLVAGNVERIQFKNPFISISGKSKHIDLKGAVESHVRALEIAIGFLLWRGFDLNQITVVGHRVVHGGEQFTKPMIVNKVNIKLLSKYNSLAPLHNPNNISVIKAAVKLLPQAKNIACFDTEWYSDMPPAYFLYSLPLKYYHKYGIRQFGFHGFSHEWAARKAAIKLNKPLNKLNLITCHLGSGSSITAVRQGKALETSMGMTPLAGLSMGSRSGDLDANIPLYMIQDLKMKPEQVFEVLNFQSGWLGLAGVADFRQIMADSGYKISGFKSRQGKTAKAMSKLVLQKYLNEIVFYIGGYSSLLKKVDVVVFTGAIGAQNADFRKLVKKDLHLGKIKFFHINTNEELMIAKKARSRVEG